MTFWIALGLVLFHVVKGAWAIALLVGTALLETGQTLFWLRYSQRRRIQVGAETLIGQVVEVAEECAPYGLVRVQGELWRARCEAGASRGERVRVAGRDGLTLEVVREEAESERARACGPSRSR
ncbi:MAG TPA: NfeD family protein [Gaiellaceae bacterium]|nr:NfeD family protein [Gaiellaceae bacterium]